MLSSNLLTKDMDDVPLEPGTFDFLKLYLKHKLSSIYCDTGFILLQKTEEICFVSLYETPEPKVKSSVIINRDYQLSINVHGHAVPTVHMLWTDMPVDMKSVEDIVKILVQVNQHVVCEGCYKVDDLLKCKIVLPENSDDHVIDFISDSKQSTVRSKSCKLLVGKAKEKCVNCCMLEDVSAKCSNSLEDNIVPNGSGFCMVDNKDHNKSVDGDGVSNGLGFCMIDNKDGMDKKVETTSADTDLKIDDHLPTPIDNSYTKTEILTKNNGKQVALRIDKKAILVIVVPKSVKGKGIDPKSVQENIAGQKKKVNSTEKKLPSHNLRKKKEFPSSNDKKSEEVSKKPSNKPQTFAQSVENRKEITSQSDQISTNINANEREGLAENLNVFSSVNSGADCCVSDVIQTNPYHEEMKSLPRGKFKCDTCKKNFKSKTGLDSHTNTNPKHMCHVCSRTFCHPIRLKLHLMSHYPEDKPFECSKCIKKFKTAAYLKDHSKVHTGERKFQCSKCGKCFSQMAHLRHHLSTHIPDMKQHKCPECNKSYLYKWDLEVHLRMHTGERPFSCQFCEKTFKCKYQLRNHVKVRHDDNRGSEQDGHNDNKATYSCDKCSKKFVHQTLLRKHRQQCKFCVECDKYIVYGCKHFPREKKHKCNKCEKMFTNTQSLKEHIKIVHMGERDVYNCEICNKTFSSKTNAARHQFLHTGQKPFSCDICEKAFATKGQLKAHKFRHTGVKPFKCETCEKAFAEKGQLKKHAKCHK